MVANIRKTTSAVLQHNTPTCKNIQKIAGMWICLFQRKISVFRPQLPDDFEPVVFLWVDFQVEGGQVDVAAQIGAIVVLVRLHHSPEQVVGKLVAGLVMRGDWIDRRFVVEPVGQDVAAALHHVPFNVGQARYFWIVRLGEQVLKGVAEFVEE